MTVRAHVIMRLEPEGRELKIQSIGVFSEPSIQGPPEEILVEWFRMTGPRYEDAYRNCVESIAVQLNNVERLVVPVLRACSPTLRDEVKAALGSLGRKED